LIALGSGTATVCSASWLHLRADIELVAVWRDGDALGHFRHFDTPDDGAAFHVDDDNVGALHRHEDLAERLADDEPMSGAADVDPLDTIVCRIDDEDGVAQFAGAPERTRRIDHDAVGGIDGAEIDHPGQRLRGQIDHGNAAVGIYPPDENTVAVDRAVSGAPVRRERELVRRARHVDGLRQRQRCRVEEVHLMRGLRGHDQIRTARPIIEINHELTPLRQRTTRPAAAHSNLSVGCSIHFAQALSRRSEAFIEHPQSYCDGEHCKTADKN